MLYCAYEVKRDKQGYKCLNKVRTQIATRRQLKNLIIVHSQSYEGMEMLSQETIKGNQRPR